MAASVKVAPVTGARLDDFIALFEARGAPHYCWCAGYRSRDFGEMSDDDKRTRMCGLVQSGIPIGVLAFVDDEPVGWCSIAPRESYQKLERSRTMPRVHDVPTWTVLCFFVPRTHRGEGIAHALLAGAVRYARAEGAVEIEGYPFDTAGVSSTHRGHSSIFAAAGFTQQGRRWVLT